MIRKTTEMRARLDDRLGLWAVTYLLFFVKLCLPQASRASVEQDNSAQDRCGYLGVPPKIVVSSRI
jgi:hypothetical protein